MSEKLKAVVASTFIDKDTKEKHEVGSTYETESPDRISYLQEKGYLEESKHPPEDKGEEGNEENEFPKHSGGGYYELSNGEKVKGKEEAQKAQSDLDAGE
ncbi:hypothetical protein [Halobacillus aidingensis]|uniref:Uncharacterized protein n=1 Tax=Halobacillus aidingensis TaxID=240303 RepID=A0A1H0MGC3_HALAD|nr:hypothetical protein [Halobacillus aidingensis]SDO79391.1 hypothetical protein SAMN05421677_10827 [Halobacillus aidingensis]